MSAAPKTTVKKTGAREMTAKKTASLKATRKKATKKGRASTAAAAVGRTAGTVSRRIEGAIASLRSPAKRTAVRRRLEKALAETERTARKAGSKARQNAGKIAAVAGAGSSGVGGRAIDARCGSDLARTESALRKWVRQAEVDLERGNLGGLLRDPRLTLLYGSAIVAAGEATW